MRSRIANKDTCFKDLHGYAWALEQSTRGEGGYHVHILMIYDGTKLQNGSYHAQKVGKKWIEITNELGCYFNPHAKEY